MTDARSGTGGAPGVGDGSDADLLAEGEALLSVRDLAVTFETPEGSVRAVDGVDFDVRAGETLCLVGESGSGKTVTCRSITGLVDDARSTVGGLVSFDGTELTTASERTLRRHRGTRIAHVFQEPGDALDPVYTVGRQLREAINNTTGASGAAARKRMLELLDLVEISTPTRTAEAYPHELSGGQKQRVLVAMALSGDPDLLIADEPTAELDVTTQASLLRLFADLQAELGMAMLYVSHDFGVVAQLADRVAVMYAGTVMERGPLEAILEHPAHPYTRALLGCLPGHGGELRPIEGQPPDAADLPAGCRFHPRCPHAVEDCTRGDQPPTYERADGDGVASCVFYGPDRDPATILEAATDDPTAANGGTADGEASGAASAGGGTAEASDDRGPDGSPDDGAGN